MLLGSLLNASDGEMGILRMAVQCSWVRLWINHSMDDLQSEKPSPKD